MSLFSDKQLLVVAGIGALGLWYLAHESKKAAQQAAQAVNPVNPDNVFNTAANSAWDAVTGSKHSIGADIAAWLHPATPLNTHPATMGNL